MKRFRMWMWVRIARLGGGIANWAQRRGAKACGCDGCRPIWDVEARRKIVTKAVAEMLREMGMAEAGKPADRRPS